MDSLYIIVNQHGHYLGKNKAWQDGRDPRTLYRTPHEDEALNTLFEVSAKDIELRGKVMAAEVNDKGQPEVTISDIPLPQTEDEARTEQQTTTPAG
ncbi:MAG: hypothetical protein CR978_00720 [Gammaproteobacteria bacterium]|nr:MAG: hypothetical protein CR978_00720 [Gammaproteobacteria bacterium]